jgi:hypothetical protein
VYSNERQSGRDYYSRSLSLCVSSLTNAIEPSRRPSSTLPSSLRAQPECRKAENRKTENGKWKAENRQRTASVKSQYEHRNAHAIDRSKFVQTAETSEATGTRSTHCMFALLPRRDLTTASKGRLRNERTKCQSASSAEFIKESGIRSVSRTRRRSDATRRPHFDHVTLRVPAQ